MCLGQADERHFSKCGTSRQIAADWESNTFYYYDFTTTLFEVMDEGRYTYCGRIELVGKPYTETQPGEDGKNRLVWMFPVRPVPENDVKKPAIFVFKDMDDYRTRGKNVDAEYNKTHINKSKKSSVKATARRVRHKAFGEGTVIEIKDGFIIVNFEKAGRKQLNYKLCMDKGLIEFL